MFSPDHEMDGGPHCKSDEPEPEEDVDLLVDDVDGKNTLGIMSLNITTGTVLVEGALGHPGEHPGHRVGPALLLHLNKGGRVDPVLGELVAEEAVGEEDLTDDVDQVETVGEEDVDGPAVVFSERLHQVAGQGFDSLLSVLFIEVEPGQASQQPPHLPILHRLEDVVREVEHDSLQEEDEGDPLVVGLVGDLVSLLVVLPHSGVDEGLAPLPRKMSGQGEGAHDEAVGVHDVLGDGPVVWVSVLDAGDVNPIPDILHTGHQDAANQEDDARHSIMEL